MRVSVNYEPLQATPPCATFEELIAFIESETLPAGEVITRIVIDGEDVDEEMEQDLYTKPLGSFELVEFYSERTIDLARQGLSDARELLPALAEDLPGVAAELRAGNIRDGLEMFARCVEVISWYVSLVTALDILFRRVSSGSPLETDSATTAEDLSPESALDETSAEEGPELRTFASVENLRQKLMEVERSQHNNDAVLLSDLIEYEILPIVNLWNEELAALTEAVRLEGASA